MVSLAHWPGTLIACSIERTGKKDGSLLPSPQSWLFGELPEKGKATATVHTCIARCCADSSLSKSLNVDSEEFLCTWDDILEVLIVNYGLMIGLGW